MVFSLFGFPLFSADTPVQVDAIPDGALPPCVAEDGVRGKAEGAKGPFVDDRSKEGEKSEPKKRHKTREKRNFKMAAPPGALRAAAWPLLPRRSPLLSASRITRGGLTILGTARPRSAGEASMSSTSSLIAAESMDLASSSSSSAAAAPAAAALPPAPIRSSSSDAIEIRQQRPGSAPPAPTNERAPRAEVAASIRGHHQQQRRRQTANSSSVDRVLAARAPAEEASSSLWGAPEFERVAGQSDYFPVGWVERGGGGAGAAEARGEEEQLPPAPVRSSSSSSSSRRRHPHRPLFPELHGSRLIVVDRHPFGDRPLLIPVPRGATAAVFLLGAGLLFAAAAAVVRKARGGGGGRKDRKASSPLSSPSSAAESSADALLRQRGEAAAARLRSRFAGALDGGDQSGGRYLGREAGGEEDEDGENDDDDDDDDENEGSDESRQRRNKEAERAFRSFFAKSKMHLVDEDAWSKEKKE